MKKAVQSRKSDGKRDKTITCESRAESLAYIKRNGNARERGGLAQQENAVKKTERKKNTVT